MQRVNKSIRDNYEKYCLLISGEKKIMHSPIVLDCTKQSRADIKEKSVGVKHSLIPDNIDFEIENKKNDAGVFKFRLVCKELCQQPFFRYDSTGPTHKNSNLNVPIYEQQVMTPHFHKYTEDGKEIAYKTNILKEPSQVKALEDISLCIAHFCHEAKVYYKSPNEYPDLISDPGQLPFPKEMELDPLKNVNFKLYE